MPTTKIALDTTQYVQVNSSFNSVVLQSVRDEVRIVLSDTKPIKGNSVFHTLNGSDNPLKFESPDTNIWALAMTDNATLIVSEMSPSNISDYMMSVARGRIPNTTPYGSYGKRTSTGAETNRVIWPNGIFTLPPATGVQMSLVSTDAADAAAGTNIQTIEIHYLDANLIEQSEFVTLQGLTPVLTVATDIRFINCIHVHTFGTSPYAAGNITASNGGVTYSQISTNELRCTSSARMVPSGKVCYVAGAVAGAVSGTASSGVFIQLVASELDVIQYVDPMILFPQSGIGLQDTSTSFNFPVPQKFSAGTVIALQMTTDKTATVGASWFGWLEDA